ncbi:thioredoxin [Flavobacteriaceae bacterium S0825]|uniref:thioredoxin n=1 Tax=Gaetbulibacter sp. S0825 TaxID=2720084 RepID=UPI0014305508|nr:thioredoxin [Gaetbulibacter sp. S0825]MCK0109969.1 thioredoxin [Flavobacteriaceae bacterium S0825]NIX65598.1 thioredoxin [Gaetbulibacter sp. S0825]
MISKFSEIIDKPIPVLVDFYAEWCGPCQVMSPILKEVKDQLNDIVSIVKINVDKNQELSGKYQVRGVPTFLIFKKGQLVWRQSGIVKKEELINIINKFS